MFSIGVSGFVIGVLLWSGISTGRIDRKYLPFACFYFAINILFVLSNVLSWGLLVVLGMAGLIGFSAWGIIGAFVQGRCVVCLHILYVSTHSDASSYCGQTKFHRACRPCGYCGKSPREPRKFRLHFKLIQTRRLPDGSEEEWEQSVCVPWDCECLEKVDSTIIFKVFIQTLKDVNPELHWGGVSIVPEVQRALKHLKPHLDMESFRTELCPAREDLYDKICEVLNVTHCPTIKSSRRCT